MNDLLIEHPRPGVTCLTLHRPDTHNAITVGMQRSLDDILDEAGPDPDCRCIVLTGAGSRAFSSGFDIDELVALTDEQHDAVQHEREGLLWRWTTSPVPTIAAVRGLSQGMGTIYATTADLRVGGPSTTFKVTAGRYGGANLTWILPSLLGTSAALDILLTGRDVEAHEAKTMGLLNRLAADDADVLTTALELAEDIAAQPPEAMREIRELTRAGTGKPLRARFDAENLAMTTTLKPKPMRDVFTRFLATRRNS